MQNVVLPLDLVIKLGSIAVHADEYLGPTGHDLDRQTIQSLLQDEQVQKFLVEYKGLLPLKR